MVYWPLHGNNIDDLVKLPSDKRETAIPMRDASILSQQTEQKSDKGMTSSRGAEGDSLGSNLRDVARDLFLHTLDKLQSSVRIRETVRVEGETLHVGQSQYPLEQVSKVIIVSLGKAAVPMGEELLEIIQSGLLRGQPLEALLVGSSPVTKLDPRITLIAGDHPLPGSNARKAAALAQKLLSSCDVYTLVLFLISGGASAMIERALDPEITLEDEISFHSELVRSGLPIVEMNALRKHFSAVKGGRLAVLAAPATECTLLISDVPDDMVNMVGSGPSLPDSSTVEDCRRILAANSEHMHLPERVLAFFNRPELEETPKAEHPAFARSKWISVLSSDDLCKKASEFASAQGFYTVMDNSCDEWEYQKAAAYLLNRLRELRLVHKRVCLLSAGEISVRLPSQHGIGGRNQQFVLECARLMTEQGIKATVLSGGSDGLDGNSPAAGAVCDETSLERSAATGYEVHDVLARFDSYSLFQAIGDAVVTGPTGNNIRDLRILLSEA